MSASDPRRKRAWLGAVGLVVTLPLAALLAAPAGAQVRPLDSPPSGPGSDLAGISSSATATAIRVQPLVPGFVGAGNVALGNLIEADLPYAASSTSTGPANSGTATPVYPGPTASELGTVFQTFAPLPPAFVTLLNDPVLAQSAYPEQTTTKSSASYAPPGGSLTGVGTASTTSTASGTTSTAALSDTSPLGPLPGPIATLLKSVLGILNVPLSGSLLEIGSSTANSSSSIGASTVTDTAHSDVGRISLLGGLIQIAGVSSDAAASSNGVTATQSNSLKIGAVTVLGHAASIGPNGIQVDTSGLGPFLPGIINNVLHALQQAGLSISTIAPAAQTEGSAASVSSGALDVAFFDSNIPNPNGLSPIHAVGLNLDLGLSQASANATALPPFPPVPATTLPVATPSVPSGTASAPPPPASGGGGTPAAYVPGTPGQVETVAGTPASSSSPASGGSPATYSPGPPSSSGSLNPLGFMGLPVKVSWVVLAFLLSLVAAGPLLAYANWQLLRGRSP